PAASPLRVVRRRRLSARVVPSLPTSNKLWPRALAPTLVAVGAGGFGICGVFAREPAGAFCDVVAVHRCDTLHTQSHFGVLSWSVFASLWSPPMGEIRNFRSGSHG